MDKQSNWQKDTLVPRIPALSEGWPGEDIPEVSDDGLYYAWAIIGTPTKSNLDRIQVSDDNEDHLQSLSEPSHSLMAVKSEPLQKSSVSIDTHLQSVDSIGVHAEKFLGEADDHTEKEGQRLFLGSLRGRLMSEA
jgi:hypothetical protein